MSRSGLLIASSILAMAAMRTGSAWAQTAPTAAEQAVTASSSTLGDIVVTARRRNENLQDTPIAITAVSGAALQERSVRDLVDLSRLAPSLNSTKGFAGGSYANFFIRGVGQADQVVGVDPGVALYIDGVYLGRSNGADIANLDLDHVEVLRGPQGTLFGKNTLGGAINIFTGKPTNELAGSVTTIAGSRNWGEVRGWLNAPLVDETLLARISLSAKTQDGYGFRVYDAHRFGDVRNIAGRGHLLWKATDNFSIDFQADYTRERGTGTMVKLVGVGALGFLPADYGQYIVDQKGYVSNSNYDPGRALDVWGTAVTADLSLGETVSLKSITAYRALRQKTGNDFDGGPLSLIDQGMNTDQNQFSQELQIAGQGIDDRLNWVVGGYYFRENANQSVPLFVFSPTALNQVTYLDIENLAAFGQATFKANGWLSFTGGLRYTYEKKKQISQAFFFRSYLDFYDLSLNDLIYTPPQYRGLVTQAATPYQESWESITPKVGVEAKLSPDIMAYASWSEGFKGGGFNSREAPTSDFSAYDPEELTTYEIGLKTELLDRTLRLNLAGYYSNYRNVQLLVLRLTPEGAPQIATQNAAKARIYGFEAEADWKPSSRVSFNAALGYVNTKYLELAAGARSAGVDITDPLVQTPKWTINIGAQYALPLGNDKSLTYRLDFSHKSSFFHFAASNELDREPPYSIVNMRLTYRSDDGWQATIFSNNVFDKYYNQLREDIRTAYDVSLDWPAEPRTFGIELGYKF